MFLFKPYYNIDNNQWRNSYGLRVGKLAGTRAEGAPGGPLDSCVPAKIAPEIAFSKRCPFPTLFFKVWLLSSHNDAFHKLMKSKSFGCP